MRGLVKLFLVASREVRESVLSFDTFSIIEKERILRELDECLRRLTDKSDSWYESNLRSAYRLGSHDVMEYLQRIGVKNIIYTQEDYDTVSQLVDRSKKFTHEAISGVKRNTSRVLDDFTIKRIQQIISKQGTEIGTLKELKGELLDYMKEKGVTIKDSAGRNWKLDRYADMVARTDMMNSYNQGVVNQILHRGGDLAYITEYSGCRCEICQEWEGKIVSISGKDERYPSLEDAYAEGMFHPNCKHRLRPFHEEFEEKKENDIFGDLYETQMKGLEGSGYQRKYMEHKR